jgi:hypothetical protein
MRSSETSVLTRAKRRHIPQDGILMVTAVKTSTVKQDEELQFAMVIIPKM